VLPKTGHQLIHQCCIKLSSWSGCR